MSETFQDYLQANTDALQGVDEVLLSRFINGLRSVRSAGGSILIAGNGGSAATASHAVADFVKTVEGFGGATLKSLALSEMTSLQTALGNDIEFAEGYAFTLRRFATKADGVLIISVSGTSPNLLRAAEAAAEIGIPVFSMVGSRGRALAEASDYAIIIPSNDYQVVENAHLTLVHWIAKTLG